MPIVRRLVEMAGPILDGCFAVNKPMGMSSAQVIRDCQHHFNPSEMFKSVMGSEENRKARYAQKARRQRGRAPQVKIGHGGTLDPLATGVLILGVGKGTKSLQSFLDCTKTYETIVVFGASTDTYDRVGKVLKRAPYDHITRPMVEEALNSFRGKHQQMPPLFSALKMQGKPLYEYAREGKPLPRKIETREVDVLELEMLEWYEPGTHNHRWPTDDATDFERNFAEQVWKIEKDQSTQEELTPEQEQQESEALEAHENFKRKADESVDALIYDKVNKRRKNNPAGDNESMMSGALGDRPPPKPPAGRGSNLIPPPPDPNTPPPWDDKGPPAAKIRFTVTSGFYVRSFCHDLGAKLGSAGLMAELCRSRQRTFEVGGENCLEYSDLAKGEDTWAPKLASMLAHWNNELPSSAPTKHVGQRTRNEYEEKPNEDQTASLARPHSTSPRWSDGHDKKDTTAQESNLGDGVNEAGFASSQRAKSLEPASARIE